MKLLKGHRWVKPLEQLENGDRFRYGPHILTINNCRVGDKAGLSWYYMRKLSGKSARTKRVKNPRKRKT